MDLKRPHMRFVFLLIIGVILARAKASAQTDLHCGVCSKLITNQFMWCSSPTLRERVPVCVSCARLDTLCFHCGIPVLSKFLKLDDDRLLCPQDAETAVLDSAEAVRIFGEAKGELRTLFADSGRLPDDNVSLRLVNKWVLQKLMQLDPNVREKPFIQGLTHTRIGRENGTFVHVIYLLSGLPRARFRAVAAHEYSHAWCRENLPINRLLEKEAEEGFCELVAYKVMGSRHEPLEQKVILANNYTHGHVQAFLQTEEKTRFWEILEWMKTGSERSLAKNLPPDGKESVSTSEPLKWMVLPQAPPTPVPATLVLKGIAVNARERFALINDTTVRPNERARVRVGNSNIVIQCLEISTNSVRIRVPGLTNSIELQLDPN